jgi:hypothetical protein
VDNFRGAGRKRKAGLAATEAHQGERMRYAYRWRLGAIILLALAAAGCGGYGGGTLSGGTTTNAAVSISPASVTVGYGSTQQFTAAVTGSTNSGVTWSVSSASSSSSSQIGSISSSGLYAAPAATPVSAAGAPQLVTVNPGSTVSGTNIPVPALNSVTSVTVTATSQADTSQSASATVTLTGLSILAVGQCTQSTTDPAKLNCSAGSTGTEISQGATIDLFVAGYGILPGTTYSISTNPAAPDVVVIQPASGNFKLASDGVTPVVHFSVTVSPTATLGPRNLVVTNQGNELTSFAGAVEITQ